MPSKNDYKIDKKILRAIEEKAKKLTSNISLMEVCGTHTMSIQKYGIKSMLPDRIKLISGPGCPVCVTSSEYIDQAIKLGKGKDIILCTFGDMVRVPGTKETLENVRIQGQADVRIVYSPLDCLDIARNNPEKGIVFLAVGFETTAPVIGLAVKNAKAENLGNFYILSGLKLLFPALKELLSSNEIRINGLICPGHVTAITGEKSYNFIAEEYNIPCVVAGFESSDILASIDMLINQIVSGKASVENAYKRVGTIYGNSMAMEIINEVFEPSDDSWRGFGLIKNSGLKLSDEYKGFDIRKKMNIGMPQWKGTQTCKCGDVVKGVIEPSQCGLFGKTCTPDNPKGPCMVSGEGSCAAFYKFSLRN
ncbi:MAG: hydrogenase formation protein HypD [Methanococcaceae archaeon]